MEAVSRSQAVIAFDLDGNIQEANHNFLTAMGYAADEIIGRHHRVFVDPVYAASQAYRDFWAALNAGHFISGRFLRLGKGGREVWIEAAYNPILNENGKPYKVIKYATDVTKSVLEAADHAGQIAAIGKSHAVISFQPDGIILSANQNFLKLFEYDAHEIVGRHHSMFVEPGFEKTPNYAAFWQKLQNGEYDAGEFKRISKSGAEIWIQASYNPIFDPNGKLIKIVKFATDITLEKLKVRTMPGK